MRAKTAKTLINQMIKRYKRIDIVAIHLGVSPRYIYMLQKKERKASPSLIKLIKILLNN